MREIVSVNCCSLTDLGYLQINVNKRCGSAVLCAWQFTYFLDVQVTFHLQRIIESENDLGGMGP